jgi:hypothetical protein
MRILCLWLPRLGATLAARSRPALAGRAFVLIAGHGDEAVVADASPEAAALGVLPGLTAGQARCRAPGAVFLADNASACLDELERLASIVALRATTAVAAGGRDTLLIDITNAAGNDDEPRLASRLAGLVSAWAGVEARAGVADTRAGALDAARFARRWPVVTPPGDRDAPAEDLIVPIHREHLEARPSSLASERAAARLAALLDALLSARGLTFRQLTLSVGDGGTTTELRVSTGTPQTSCATALEAARQRAGTTLEASATVRVRLERLGPLVPIAAAPAAMAMARRDRAAEPLRRAS